MLSQRQFDQQLPIGAAGPVAITLERGVATLDVAASEAISCELNSIHLQVGEANRLPPMAIQAAAERLAQSLRYLSEPLALIECDEEAQAAQVRSSPPRHQNAKTVYFEGLVCPDEVWLRRYVRQSPSKRHCCEFQLTRESIRQVLVDLHDLYGPQPAAKKPLRA